jgi:L-alanine-DL-glutamate epimerase-like enolase superfamily enzyme
VCSSDLVRCGFTTLKMKVAKDFGARPDEDLDRVRAVRQAIGPSTRLAVDANQAWSAADALAFARRIADLDIAWFEEPVHSANRAALRKVCAASPVPVAMGESENHWLGFRDLVDCGVAHLQPSPHGLPGYERWRDALAFAETSGRAWSSGGYSHLTAVYVATREGGVVEYLRAIIGHLATCFAVKPAIERGVIRLPATPGLPVRVDWDGLRARGAVHPLCDERRAKPIANSQ